MLSTFSGYAPEEIAKASSGPMWFQLYAADRTEAGALIARAADAGYRALVVTVDTPVVGQRERDMRNGVAPPLRITSGGVVNLGPQILARPGWAWRMAREGLSMFGNAGIRGSSALNPIASPFTWSDIEWIRGIWKGPLLVKGVLTGPDALRAVECGSEAVIVSNHGGRQLEGAPATLWVLPEIAAAVGDDAEVIVDGGIRRGSDVVKALALGAKAVMIGRPYLYGLTAGGQAGVERVIRILRDEITRTLVLMGCGAIGELDTSWLLGRGWWS